MNSILVPVLQNPRSPVLMRGKIPSAVRAAKRTQLRAQVATHFSAQPLMFTARKSISSHFANPNGPNCYDEADASPADQKLKKLERFEKTRKLERATRVPSSTLDFGPCTLDLGPWTACHDPAPSPAPNNPAHQQRHELIVLLSLM